MLQEILLSLSSYHSEIWETVTSNDGKTRGVHDYISEPEQAMLQVLGHISRLHIQIKHTTARLAAGHKSVICRAIYSAIDDVHLAAFRQQVLKVEAAILSQDAAYVGGYGIVPLSTIVSDFQPWTRRLEWLSSVTDYAEVSGTTKNSSIHCMGKAMLDWLDSETNTGYLDIEALATQLLTTGQKVWLRIAASWILYGKLPVFGSEDLFVQRNVKALSILDQYVIEESMIPNFVTSASAECMLAIGSAVNHIQSHISNSHGALPSNTRASIMMPKHLRALESLPYPINASVFEGTMTGIDESISQNALSQLLSFEDISRMLRVIQEYVPLGNGEFAVSVIEHATAMISVRQQPSTAKPVRKIGRSDDLILRDSELNNLLAKCWDEFAALQSGISFEDDVFSLARKMLVLRNVHAKRLRSLYQP